MAINAGSTTYYQAKRGIVQDGLVLNLDAAVDASYPGNGTTWYDLASSNSGTLTNGPTFDRDNGGSIVFDGIDDYIIQTSAINISSTAYTVCGWFKRRTGSTGTIASYRGSIPVLYQLDTSGPVPRMIVRDSSGNIASVSATTTIANGTWYFAAGVRDGNNVYVYVNGVQENSGSATFGSFSITDTPKIGALVYNAGATSSQFMDGNIQNVRIYNRALTAAEVLKNYNATKGRFE